MKLKKSSPGCEALPLGRTPALKGGELHSNLTIVRRKTRIALFLSKNRSNINRLCFWENHPY